MSGAIFARLDAVGLNLHAVFDLAALPAAVRGGLGDTGAYRQLLLIGHGGRLLWQRVTDAGTTSAEPIDDYSIAAVRDWFASEQPRAAYALRYPGNAPVGLQALGRLAGWHHESPFRVGINATWGSWFAYRVVALADTALPVTIAAAAPSPCTSCAGRPCIAACPAGALDGDAFALAACLRYRTQPESRCALTCLARIRCPLQPAHRYDDAQLAHSYGRSLAMIARPD